MTSTRAKTVCRGTAAYRGTAVVSLVEVETIVRGNG